MVKCLVYNWNTDTSKLRKNKTEYTIWKLNQLINFGLGGEKLDLHQVRKHWSKISTDSATAKFLRLLIWGRRS